WTIVPHPGGPHSIVYCGTDGGVDVSTDGGSTFDPRNGGGLQTGLFYNIAVKPDASASVTAGALQDNRIQTTAGGVTPPEWLANYGGDGWDVAWDGSSPPVLYSTSGGPSTTVAASNDDGASFPTPLTPPWTAADTGGFLLTPLAADPSAAGILYASGNQNLWQRQSGGTWRIILTPGTSGNVDIAPTNGNNVAIAAGSQVYLSTNALASTVGPPSGVTFTNITANLPSRNVSRVAFDPLDPNTLYAVLTGFSSGTAQNVFRTNVGATAWTNISPAVDVPCGAIAIDGTTSPSTLYVGTDLGVIRSTDLGASWSVLDDLRFPNAPVFDLGFNPHAGVLRAGTYGRGVFEFTRPTGPAIAVELEDGLAFGTVCTGPHYLTLTVSNVGAADLVISNVERLFGSSDFAVLSSPATPLSLAPGESIDFTVAYTPSSPGSSRAATIRITSDDPAAPFVDLTVTGSAGVATLVTAIADGGNLGNACLGSFADQTLTINNAGTCPLHLGGITGSAGFLAPSVAFYPLLVASGDSVDVVIRFEPTAYGAQAGTVTIYSDDPASPAIVPVSGVCPAPRAVLIIADTGAYGRVCVGSFKDEPLIITNSGSCTLSVSGIASSSADFIVPDVTSYPVTIGSGDALPIPIRFQPTSFGSKAGTITVSSDDPASPIGVPVTGEAPPGKLAVTGSTIFGGVSAGCFADRTVTITNVGDCALDVRKVRLRRPSRYWRLLNNPFPATLHPGSSLSVVVQYRADEKCARITELVIKSNDPITPRRCLELVAYTVWDHGRCGDDCGDCGRGETHPSRCHQGYPACCDDDDERRPR
ncbi:MAG: choice-of-anchor D domain-containing protein, partial [Jatrophihabitantaceae bacterium]